MFVTQFKTANMCISNRSIWPMFCHLTLTLTLGLTNPRIIDTNVLRATFFSKSAGVERNARRAGVFCQKCLLLSTIYRTINQSQYFFNFPAV